MKKPAQKYFNQIKTKNEDFSNGYQAGYNDSYKEWQEYHKQLMSEPISIKDIKETKHEAWCLWYPHEICNCGAFQRMIKYRTENL